MPTTRKRVQAGSSGKAATTGKRSYRLRSDTIKAKCIAALIAGVMPTQIARDFRVPLSTLSTWKSQLTPEQIESIRSARGGMIEEKIVTFVDTSLDALTAQARVAADPTYIRQQNASDLAELHQVMSSQTVRVLEAMQRADAGVSPDHAPDDEDASGDQQQSPEPTQRAIMPASQQTITVQPESSGGGA